MTTKTDFTDEEWARLERAPIVAGMAISLADPGGPIEAVKETMATIKTITEAAQSGGGGELVDAVAKSFAEKTKKRESPMGDFKPKGAHGRSGDPRRAESRERAGHAEGHARGGSGLSRVAAHARPSGRPMRPRRAASWASTRSA